MSRRRKARALDALTWAIVAVSLLPIAWMLLSSLRHYSDIAAGEQLSTDLSLRFENYRDIWVNVDFFNTFNHPNNPTAIADTGILSTRNSGSNARVLQLGLRLSW